MQLLRTLCLLLKGRKVSQWNLWLHYIHILTMCMSVVQRVGVFCYPPLWYITLYVQELLKTTILETSIVPRIMLYTLWSLLCVCLFIKQLRNPHLLWIFRKFLPNIPMHPSFPRVHLTEGWDGGLTPVLPLHSLAHWPEQGLQRLRLDFKAISSRTEANLVISSFGQVLVGIAHGGELQFVPQNHQSWSFWEHDVVNFR